MRNRIGAAVVGFAATGAVLTAGPASADMHWTKADASGYSAQAQRAGLTAKQAEALQQKVDRHLAKVPDSRQTGPNTIAFPGGKVVVEVPGGQYSGALRSPYSDCRFEFCGGEDSGTAYSWDQCRKYDVRHMSGPGFWWNSQIDRMRVHMYGAQGERIYTTPNAYSEDKSANWSPVYWIKTCIPAK
ncbi:hypothetical protein ABT390_00090 [Streptomyces aurantiacus]|nr:hypothetical protein [Streptomyces aurantiacus]